MENWYDSSNVGRALRGGSWFSFPQFVRAAFRNYFDPAVRKYGYGFRLARTLP
jgi:formylglycine-generating enzyme required for sulfatase activity